MDIVDVHVLLCRATLQANGSIRAFVMLLLELRNESKEIGEVHSEVLLLRTCIQHLEGELLVASTSVLGIACVKVDDGATSMYVCTLLPSMWLSLTAVHN